MQVFTPLIPAVFRSLPALRARIKRMVMTTTGKRCQMRVWLSGYV